MVVCSQLPENGNTFVTNMTEYLAAEVVEEHSLPTPLVWVEHYPEHEGAIGEWSLVEFSSWNVEEVRLGGAWRHRVGAPRWSHLTPEVVGRLVGVRRPRPNSGPGCERDRSRTPGPPQAQLTAPEGSQPVTLYLGRSIVSVA